MSTEPTAAIAIAGPLLGQGAVCEPILRSLPQWFGIEEAVVQYVRDIETLPTFLGSVNGSLAGFLTVRRHFHETAEMHVLGVRPQFHRMGTGRAMVRHIEVWLAGQGVEYLQVKTLGPSRTCPEYDMTREFYRAMGFRPLEEFKTLWGERNPCLVMVKRLSPTPE